MRATLTRRAFSEKFRAINPFTQTQEIAALQQTLEEIKEPKRGKNAAGILLFYLS